MTPAEQIRAALETCRAARFPRLGPVTTTGRTSSFGKSLAVGRVVELAFTGLGRIAAAALRGLESVVGAGGR